MLVLQLPWLLLGCEFLERWHLQCQALASCSNPGLLVFTVKSAGLRSAFHLHVLLRCVSCRILKPRSLEGVDPSLLAQSQAALRAASNRHPEGPKARIRESDTVSKASGSLELSGNIHPTFAHIPPALGCGADTLATAVAEAA